MTNVKACVVINMNHLDMCSGIGGWALAFRELGINTVAFCEIEKYPQRVLQKNFPGIPIFNDLKELTYEQIKERTGVDSIDIVTCSYPCQPFSVAGKQKGEEDPRHLWPDTFRIVQECQPTWFVGENVGGHIKLGLDTVLEDLASEGYDTRTFAIPASSVGAWHQRQRIWIIGHKEVSDTSSERSSTQREREHRELEKTSQGKEKTRSESTVRTSSSCANVSDTDNSRNRTSKHEVDQKQPQTDQGWQEQSQSELGGHSENVSDTESLRSGRRSGEECRSPQWQFLQEEQEGCEIRGEVEGRSTSSGEDVSDTESHSSHDRELGHSKETSSEKRKIRSKTRRNGSNDVSDTDIEGLERRIPGRQDQEREGELGHAGRSSSTHLQQRENWWQTESEFCGVPHGVSYGLDKGRVGRIKGLGNAIVPQIAWFIGHAIISVDISHETSDN